MKDKLEDIISWFLDQSNPVKAGIVIGIALIIILIIFLIISFVFADSPLSGDALEKYKASCTFISFQELNSNVNKYKGQHVKFTGQVVSVNHNNGRTEIVLSVTPVTGGWSTSDLIYVTYNAQTQFKAGDIVTVYGDVSGTYTYFTATNGQSILVKITARYIELTPIITPAVVGVPFTSPSTNNSNTTSLNTSGNVTNPTNTNPIPTNGQAI
jgi:starvation-inducible outer membrane lipoprotein